MKHQKMNRILAAALSAACLVPFAAMVPVDADAADIMSALEITQEMGLGFNIGTLWTALAMATMTTSPVLKSPMATQQ